MLILLMMLFALSVVAFWIDRRNLEEMHLLMALLVLICALMWVIIVPWQVQLVIFLLLLNFKILPLSQNSD